MITRRQFVGAAAAALASVSARRTWAAPSVTPTRKPSRFVQIVLRGGFDPLYSFDGRTTSEVDSRVYLPYAEKELTRASSGLVLAPIVSAIAGYADRMVVVNGINAHTVAHEIGRDQLQYFSNEYASNRSRTITGDLGEALAPARALQELRLGRDEFAEMWPTAGKVVSADIPELRRALGGKKRRDFPRLMETLQRRVKTAKDPHVHDALAATAEFLDRLPDYASPKPLQADALPYKELAPPEAVAKLVQHLNMYRGVLGFVEKVLQADTCRSIYLSLPGGWDSHTDNHVNQTMYTSMFAVGLKQLLDNLAASPGEQGGSLLDETAIVIASELGRFPLINNRQGKDHFPVMTVVAMGPGLKPGSYGATDKMTAPLSVSLATGKPASRGNVPLDINDVAATLRTWVGLPLQPWSSGRPFEFIFS